jgi:hypothetical protein
MQVVVPSPVPAPPAGSRTHRSRTRTQNPEGVDQRAQAMFEFSSPQLKVTERCNQ